MNQIDIAYENLLNFQKSLDEFRDKNLSETDTRSKLLDKILIDVLGWTETDIEREGYVKVGYFDYELKTSNFKFVVEAKKNLVVFNLPHKGNEVKLKTIIKSNEEVIKQIREYIFERGLQFGVITNGSQFIIGKFYGENWEENKCYYFKDIEDIKKHFTRFYELLSKEMISHNGRIKIAEDVVKGQSLVKDLPLSYKTEELVRNALSNDLIPIMSRVFAEIYNAGHFENNKVLKECYVSNDDVKKYNSELGSIFSDEPPTFDTRILPVKNTASTHKQISGQIFDDIENLPDPIILIGTAGAGKTTFIKYFSEVVLTQKEKKNRPFLYIDFRTYTSQTVRNTEYIYTNILSQLEDNYPELNLNKINVLKVIYKAEIEKKKSGTWAYALKDEDKINELISTFIESKMESPLLHLSKVSEYLRQVCKKRICVIFDNADQLSDDDQKEVFLLGNAINRDLKSLVIISLREGYFYKWRQKPPFNAYQSIVYHITAPPYSEVLKKRISYVIKNFKFEELTIVTDNKTVQFEKGNLNHLFKNLYDTLFNSNNAEVLDFLEQMSYPNTRAGLELFQDFILSGHSKISEYMSFSYGRGEGIPIWEFFKSIALESNYYYETSKSCILNLFHPSPSNTNHFTKIRILNYLYSVFLKKQKKMEYIEVGVLTELFKKAGYSTGIIQEELQILFQYHLISTSEYSEDIEEEIEITMESLISITPVGVYYLKKLLGRFYYLDLVLQDTVIYDPESFNEIASVFPQSDSNGFRDLKRRKQSVELFLRYLSNQEQRDLEFADNFNDSEIIFSISDWIKATINSEFGSLDNVLTKKAAAINQIHVRR